ncbi:hypothetical protein [Streptomyces mirabilis]
MAELIQQQKLDVEVDFYGFALQDLDATQVPLEYPEGREADGAFLTAHEGRLDVESAGHTHTAAMTAEVWDGEPPAADDRGATDGMWQVRVYCECRREVARLAQEGMPEGVERYLVQFWPTAGSEGGQVPCIGPGRPGRH